MSDTIYYETPDFGLRKTERLKSQKSIGLLFSQGKLVSSGNLILKYIPKKNAENDAAIKVGVTVSGKKMKKSVDRNYVKRILREAFRHKKSEFYKLLSPQFPGADFMFIYNHTTRPEYQKTMKEMEGIIKKLNGKIKENGTD
jgi:ribonuclease P protein component